LFDQSLKPPYKPSIKKDDFSKYFDVEEGQAVNQTMLTKQQKAAVDDNKDAFKGFSQPSKK